VVDHPYGSTGILVGIFVVDIDCPSFSVLNIATLFRKFGAAGRVSIVSPAFFKDRS